MNGERFLFPMPSGNAKRCYGAEPGCHACDPSTSFEAAEHLKRSGKLAAQQQAVLDALRQRDGATHAELGAFMGLHWLTPARRLPELERGGLVRKGEIRLCNVKHSRCVTRWITASQDGPQNGSGGHSAPPESTNGAGGE
jgi:hypothetical protein